MSFTMLSYIVISLCVYFIFSVSTYHLCWYKTKVDRDSCSIVAAFGPITFLFLTIWLIETKIIKMVIEHQRTIKDNIKIIKVPKGGIGNLQQYKDLSQNVLNIKQKLTAYEIDTNMPLTERH